MSLKNLFKDQSVGNVKTSIFEDKSEAESRDSVVAVIVEKDEVIPNVDYSKPENFAKFGSAEYYYLDSIENIYKNYPYDGSNKDKQEWYNNLAIYEKYLFDNEYPRTTGYVQLTSNQYVSIRPSAQPITADTTGSFIDKNLPSNNIYDTASNRVSAFYLNGRDGNTVEFWFKQTSDANTTFALFDAWNSSSAVSANYHRLSIEVITGSGFYLTYRSGSSGISRAFVDVNYSTLKNDWHHYAFTFLSNTSSNKIDATVYVDGYTGKTNASNVFSISSGNKVGNFSTNNLIANIGAYVASTTGTSISDGSGSVNGNFDEFRFWKEAKNHKSIGRNWFTHVGGGTNNLDSDSTLDLYYKFNEGILSTGSYNQVDSIILDYSGRFTNATIKNYTYACRSTGSAIDESGYFDFKEPKDPIIISSNPLLAAFTFEKQIAGSDYDINNSAQFYNLFPTWVREEDENTNKELKNISQVISSYFDKLYLQIDLLSKLKHNDYNTNLEKPLPFAKNLLEGKSLVAPELFVDATILEEVFSRNDERPYEEKLSNIKNLIYKNVYNNLTYIYKSKGTEKSFRNLFRTFGIDDEVLKFVVYSNNSSIDLSREKIDYSTSKKGLIDLSYIDNHEATIYQVVSSSYPSAVSLPNCSNSASLSNTFECQILFPNIDDKKELIQWNLTDTSASLFGVHSAQSTGSSLTWDSSDDFNYQVYAVRDSYGSKGVRFALRTTGFGLSNAVLTSSYYADVYDNTQWNFAVRIKPKISDYSYVSASNLSSSDYNLEFYGIQVIGDITQNEFSSSIAIANTNGLKALKKDKRFYLGAHRTNFTGSVLQKSDIRIINSRFWLNYLSNDVVKSHAKNFKNYSAGNSLTRPYLGLFENITPLDTLVFNWDFSNLTGSDSNGEISVKDNKISTVKNNPFSEVTNKYYEAKGKYFALNSSTIVDYDYLPVSKNKLPEEISTSDSIQILREDDILFTKETRPADNFISIENSMYSIISEEMMNMFSSVIEFSNIIGNPLNVYKKDYKEMAYLRNLFFEKVNNVPNFEKYLNLFKWIDASIGEILKQITPANADISDQIATILESHILERNKFQRRLPLLQEARKVVTYPIKGLEELNYNWTSGSAPLAIPTATKALWLKDRAERSDPYVSSGNSTIDSARQILLNALNNINKQTSYKLSGSSGNYIINDYFLTKGSIPYKIKFEILSSNNAENQIRRSEPSLAPNGLNLGTNLNYLERTQQGIKKKIPIT
jgi:hypothetical protein